MAWGKNGDNSFSPAVFNAVSFAPGALAHIVGAPAATDLRARPSGTSTTQFAPLITRGAAGGIANLYSVVGNTRPQYMLENYFINGSNLADSAYSAIEDLGFWEVVIGDPLTTYLGPGFAPYVPPTGVRAKTAVGGFNGWGVSSGSSAREDAAGNPTNVISGSAVGGTSGWIGGGSSGGTRYGW